ncbi:hypothetical protein [Streptomyces sp. NPDC014894]|uniref:hypothetical protein n=1 Tax=Streptomyces sp. NPDC014894 TaxID=3364931 RepID=UPI0037016FD4
MKNLRSAARRRPRPAAVATAAGAALLALLASGCTGSEPEAAKSYQVPDSLCGTAVEPDLLEPALPPGEKISTRKKTSVGYERCHVLVDDTAVLSVRKSWWDADTTAPEVASSERGGGVELDAQLSDDRRLAWSTKGAVGQVHCPKPSADPDQRDSRLFATFVIFGDGKAKESQMRKLITAYTESVSTSAECNAG